MVHEFFRRLFAKKPRVRSSRRRVRLEVEELEPRVLMSVAWTGMGGDNLWSNAANWSTMTAPVATDDVVFMKTAIGTSTKNSAVNSAFTIKTLTVDSSYSGTLFADANLTVNGATIQNSTMDIRAGTTDFEGNVTSTSASYILEVGATLKWRGTSAFTMTLDGTSITGAGQFHYW